MLFLYQWFYQQLPLRPVQTDEHVHILTSAEAQRLRRLERQAILLAALLGALGVLLLYLPKYHWPHLFPDYIISFKGRSFPLPMVFTVYSVLLVFIEIVLLTLLHIYCIHEVAVATGFLTYENKKQYTVQDALLLVSREKKDKSIERFGIDPLQGMNKKTLLLWNLLIALKATLTNLFFRFVIQRMMGRYALLWVQDMAGVPVFAAWNAWGSVQVLRQGRIVIMGQNLVELAVQKIFRRFAATAIDKELMFQTLEMVAISKRDYHANHAVLASRLHQLYAMQKPGAFEIKQYHEKLRLADDNNRSLCCTLIVLGFLLDGSLSRLERKRLAELHALGLPLPSWQQLVEWKDQFLQGKETTGFWQKYHL